jgi:hypothetical protein
MSIVDTLQAAPRRLLVILAVVVVLLGGLAYAASPFTAAGGLKCKGALLGSQPRNRVTTGILVGREKPVCRSEGNSRLFVAGIATVVALVIALGAVLLPVGPIEELFVRKE